MAAACAVETGFAVSAVLSIDPSPTSPFVTVTALPGCPLTVWTALSALPSEVCTVVVRSALGMPGVGFVYLFAVAVAFVASTPMARLVSAVMAVVFTLELVAMAASAARAVVISMLMAAAFWDTPVEIAASAA